ncbi:MAG: hypothetical protein JNK78_19050 [Planctomycetes bacterium]|nr:hypothetical protein [Planctomycetota bacterium]
MRVRVLVGCVLLSAASAQKPTFTWQKQTSTFEYRAISASGHPLEDFKLHQFWMMGAGRATVWRLTMPVVVGESVVAPGAYPVLMNRTDEKAAAIHVKGSGKAVGAAQDVEIAGPIGEAKKAVPKLVIGVSPDGESKTSNQAVQIEVLLGANDWRSPATVVGNQPTKAGAWTVTTWTLPANVFAARDTRAVPVAMLSNGKDEPWNLVLGKDQVSLVPAPRVVDLAAALPVIDEASIVAGKIEALPAPDAPREVLECKAASVDKDGLSVDIVCGSEAVRMRVALPKPKK